MTPELRLKKVRLEKERYKQGGEEDGERTQDKGFKKASLRMSCLQARTFSVFQLVLSCDLISEVFSS